MYRPDLDKVLLVPRGVLRGGGGKTKLYNVHYKLGRKKEGEVYPSPLNELKNAYFSILVIFHVHCTYYVYVYKYYLKLPVLLAYYNTVRFIKPYRNRVYKCTWFL